jgi:hypothetical protein
MPRQKSLATAIRNLVQAEVRDALAALLSIGTTPPKKGRRQRRKRGTWTPGSPGRPPRWYTEAKKGEKKRAARRAKPV